MRASSAQSLGLRCAIYARRSTEEHQAASLEVQIEEATRYIQSKGWTIAPEHIYVDDAISRAEFKKRPALIAMLNAAEAKTFDVVIARDDSRLGGDTYRTGIVIQDLLDAGVRLVYYYSDEEVTLEGAVEKFLVAARGFASELEREKTSQRTHEHLLAKARRGLNVGGRVYGYDNVKIMDGDRHVRTEYKINDEQAEIVREIFRRYIDAAGVRRIAKELNERRIPSPWAGKRGTGSWSPSVVWTILRRERYTGTIVWGKLEKTYRGGTKVRVRRDLDDADIVRIEVPELRIVDQELWTTAKSRMARTETKPWTSARGPKPRHMLSALARCSECGGGIKAKSAKLGSRTEKVYLCAYHHDRGASVCKNSLRQPVAEVDATVIDWIRENLLKEDLLNEVLAELRQRVAARSRATSTELPELEAQITKLQDELRNLAEAISVAKGSIPSLVEAMQNKNDLLSKLQARRAVLLSAPDVLTLEVKRLEVEARRRLRDLKALMGRSPEDARKVVESLLEGKLTFTPVETFRGRRYQVEGRLALGGVLQAPAVPYCSRPQGESNPR